MKIPTLNGWYRFNVIAVILWLVIVILSAANELALPSLHNWLHATTASQVDPLGLFPHLSWMRFVALLFVPVAIFLLLLEGCKWVVAGFLTEHNSRYLKPERLADILALIQVLALDGYAHRSEDALNTELQGKPRSHDAWASLARDHPEFFRVHPKAVYAVSLVSRHVLPTDAQGARLVSSEFTAKLLQLAIELHDRQLRRAQSWQIFVPLLAAAIAGTGSLIGILLK
jgi:hypothetical protein